MGVKKMMTGAVAALVCMAAGCGSTETTEAAPDHGLVPEYTEVDGALVVPDATEESATAAIHDWFAANTDDQEAASIAVVRDETATTVVCRGEWVVSEDASQLYTAGRVTGDTYPATLVECPNPGGDDRPEVVGVSAQEVVDVFAAADLAVPEPRDTTAGCTELRCASRVTTDAVTVLTFAEEPPAIAYEEGFGEGAHRDGLVVLSYSAARTPEADQAAYEAVLAELLAS